MKLAGATAEKNTAVEEAELKSAERKKCESHLLQCRQSCSDKVKTLESEKCGMMKMQGENDTTSNEMKNMKRNKWSLPEPRRKRTLLLRKLN